MGIKEKIIKGSTWQTISIIVNTVTSLLVIGILARLIEPSGFGIISMASTVMVFAQMFSEIGIEQYIIRATKINDAILNTIRWLSYLISIIMYLLIYAISPVVAEWYDEPELVIIIRVIAIILIISRFGRVSHALLQRNLEFNKLVIVDIISYIIGYALVGIILAYIGYGVWAIVIARISQSTIQSISYFCLKPNHIGFSIQKDVLKDVLNFGLGLISAQTTKNIAQQADFFIVGRYMGSSMLAIYDRAFKIMTIPVSYLGYVFDKVLYAAMSSIQEDSNRLINIFEKTMRLMFVASIPIQFIAMIVSKQLVLILLGSNWIDTYRILQLLTFCLALRASAGVIDAMIRLKGALFRSARIKMVFMFSVIVFSFIGAKLDNIYFVCIGVNLSFIINFILMLVLVSRVNQTKHYRLIRCLIQYYLINLFPLMLSVTLGIILNDINAFVYVILITVIYLSTVLVESYLIPEKWCEDLVYARNLLYGTITKLIHKGDKK